MLKNETNLKRKLKNLLLVSDLYGRFRCYDNAPILQLAGENKSGLYPEEQNAMIQLLTIRDFDIEQINDMDLLYKIEAIEKLPH